MKWRTATAAALVSCAACLMGARGEAQSAPAPAEGAAPAVAQTDPLSQLTPAQHDAFKVAADDVAAGRFSEALPRFKDLLGVTPLGSPAQILIAKYTAESALNSDEGGYALSLLQPITGRRARCSRERTRKLGARPIGMRSWQRWWRCTRRRLVRRSAS
jgi:hypothetical protein